MLNKVPRETIDFSLVFIYTSENRLNISFRTDELTALCERHMRLTVFALNLNKIICKRALHFILTHILFKRQKQQQQHVLINMVENLRETLYRSSIFGVQRRYIVTL